MSVEMMQRGNKDRRRSRRSEFGRTTLALVGALLATACASAGAPKTQPQTSVRLEPPPQSAPTARPVSNAPLPALPMSSTGTISDGGGRRIQALDANGQELSGVIRALAVQFGLQYQIDPSVRGIVNARLRNTTLSEALNTILPQGVTYELAAGVLRVSPARLETKIFSLDYVAISRFGTASTVIQRRLGSGSGFGGAGQAGAGGVGGAGGFGGGADVIQATSVANAWDDIRIAVEALVFETAGTAAVQAGNQAAVPGSGGAGMGGQAFSRSMPDGRRLIINPMAGTITVTSFPATLSQVESFIKTFESSIQRQVLIEAKIVEVNLERSFEFGIDWNVVANAGRIQFRNTPRPTNAPAASSVELTLSGGPGQINLVLNALSTQGNVKVLSSPRVSALNNQRAVFNVTTQEIFWQSSTIVTGGGTGAPITQSQVTPVPINVGIVLDVLPQIGADNQVTMNIRPVVTSVARTSRFPQQNGTTFEAPVIDTRESDTMARLRAGETIIIGGLMQTRTERQRSSVPVLGSIPLLGRLFTRYTDVETKAELVIFLTPTIIAGQPPAAQ
jgi:MSHA biogenesis protein MshL